MRTLPTWPGKYVGIPFLDYGRTQEGADCWGLVRLIWSEQRGLILPEHALDPKEGGDIENRIAASLEEWNVIPNGSEEPFDAVVMTGCFGSGASMRRAAMHVGLVVVPGYLIHTTANTGASVIARYPDRIAGHSIVGFYRHRTFNT